MGRGGRQDCEDYVEAALPVADRRDCRAELLHHAGAASEDRSLQGNQRSRWLRCISIPQGTGCPRQQRRLGKVRRLCAAPGAAGMVQRLQGRQLSADRVEDYHGRRYRVGRVAEGRGGLVRASASRSRAAAETQQRYRHRAVKPQSYIGGLRFNCLHPPFDDVRLRRAVLVAVNQEDYMRTIMGDDRGGGRICRSQYPCGSTYGIEVDLPVQKGDLETASKMIQAAGYHDQKAVIINPTDFATIGPLGDITYDMFKKIGINAELQSTDWGSVVQRRATREPVEKGGWSVFHTWFTGGFTLNPVVSAPFRGLGAAGWFGWYENSKIEQLTQEWLDAKDEDTRKKIAAAIQLENYAQVPTVTLGQFQIPTAYRTSLTGKLEFTGPLFWNVKRA